MSALDIYDRQALRDLLHGVDGKNQATHVRTRLRDLEKRGFIEYRADAGWRLTESGVAELRKDPS